MSSSHRQQQSNWNSLYSPHNSSVNPQHHLYGSVRSDQSDVASVSNRSDDTSFSTHPSLPSSMGGSANGGGNGSSGSRSGMSSRPASMLRRNVLAGFDSASDLGIITLYTQTALYIHYTDMTDHDVKASNGYVGVLS